MGAEQPWSATARILTTRGLTARPLLRRASGVALIKVPNPNDVYVGDLYFLNENGEDTFYARIGTGVQALEGVEMARYSEQLLRWRWSRDRSV